jgi:hypothetical protein
MRTATAYEDSDRPDAAQLMGPATVAFVLCEGYHQPVEMTRKDWATRGMEPVTGASGITAFQMLLWTGVDDWSEGWNRCFNLR